MSPGAFRFSIRMSARQRIAAICVVADLVAFAAGCTKTPTNLVLITIDTLRADHLSSYGYVRETSPNLDALAREGARFARCYAQSVTTRASHASLFTGCYPGTHGVLSNVEEYPDRPSLMTALRARGYVAAGFVSSVVLNRKFGVQRQLDDFDDAATTSEINRPNMAERPARATLDAALAYLEKRNPTRPFFLWVHLIDPHGPYAAPENPDRFVGDAHATPGRRTLPLGDTNIGFGDIPRYQILNGQQDPDYYVARYDGEIRYADEALGRFFERLHALGLYDRTLIAVTADHGETLDEPTHRRYFSHGLVAYEEDAHVPLIVHEPAGTRRLSTVDADAAVLSIDVAPTLLDLLGVDVPGEFEGRSILSGPRAVEEPIISLGSYGSPQTERMMGTQKGVLRGPWRYLINSLDGAEELYDHRNDPREGHNVGAANAEVLADLRRVLSEFLANPGTRNRASDVSPAERERLRALGYVK
jgi:choline-sulfatase